MELGKLGVWYFTDGMPAPAAAATAKRIEDLGYSTFWIPETVGRNPFVHASWLLANTTKLVIATGIANIYHREPGVTMAAQKTLAEQSGNRFLLGLGVSHKPMVEGVRGLSYGAPVPTMRSYLEKMAASPYTAVPPSEEPQTVIAALGPQMLKATAELADGTLTWCTGPNTLADYTVPTINAAAEAAGRPAPRVIAALPVCVTTDTEAAKGRAAKVFEIYGSLPSYRAMLDREGAGGAEDIAITGSHDEVVERISALADIGVTDFAAVEFPGNPDEAAATRAAVKAAMQ